MGQFSYLGPSPIVLYPPLRRIGQNGMPSLRPAKLYRRARLATCHDWPLGPPDQPSYAHARPLLVTLTCGSPRSDVPSTVRELHGARCAITNAPNPPPRQLCTWPPQSTRTSGPGRSCSSSPQAINRALRPLLLTSSSPPPSCGRSGSMAPPSP
jgi:hypothetical protein